MSDEEVFAMGRKVLTKFIRRDANEVIGALRRRTALEKISKLEKVGH